MIKHALILSILSLSTSIFSQNSLAAFGCHLADTQPNTWNEGCKKYPNANKRFLESRDYRLFMPSTQVTEPENGFPLIIGLHGGGEKAKSFSEYSNLENSNKGFIILTPDAHDAEGGGKHWNDGRANIYNEADDAQFLQDLVDDLHASGVPINKDKIFVAGMSNGGLMALHLACEYPTFIKGAAVVAANLDTDSETNCQTGQPVPLLHVIGTADNAFIDTGDIVNPINPDQINGTHIGAADTRALWQTRNQCQSPQNVARPDLSQTIPKWRNDIVMTVTEHKYTCSGAKLSAFTITGGGHRWHSHDAKNNFFITKAAGYANQNMLIGSKIQAFFESID